MREQSNFVLILIKLVASTLGARQKLQENDELQIDASLMPIDLTGVSIFNNVAARSI